MNFPVFYILLINFYQLLVVLISFLRNRFSNFPKSFINFLWNNLPKLNRKGKLLDPWKKLEEISCWLKNGRSQHQGKPFTGLSSKTPAPLSPSLSLPSIISWKTRRFPNWSIFLTQMHTSIFKYTTTPLHIHPFKHIQSN